MEEGEGKEPVQYYASTGYPRLIMKGKMQDILGLRPDLTIVQVTLNKILKAEEVEAPKVAPVPPTETSTEDKGAVSREILKKDKIASLPLDAVAFPRTPSEDAAAAVIS